MKFINRVGPGQLAINHMWLPTWIGMHVSLLQEMDARLAEHIVGKELTEETLEAAHVLVLDFLVEKFPSMSGLWDYLDGIKFVEMHGDQAQTQGR